MYNELKLFENVEFGKVRVVVRNGDPWFVANDVASALGYEYPKDAVTKHCKYAELLKGVDSTPLTDSPRGINIIPEADVYALIFRSNLPAAEKFRDWVFREVLPSIRKTGRYEVEQKVSTEPEPFIVSKLKAACFVLELAGIKDNQLALAVDKVHKRELGYSALETAEIQLVADTQCQLYTPTQLGKMLFGERKYSARKTNRR